MNGKKFVRLQEAIFGLKPLLMRHVAERRPDPARSSTSIGEVVPVVPKISSAFETKLVKLLTRSGAAKCYARSAVLAKTDPFRTRDQKSASEKQLVVDSTKLDDKSPIPTAPIPPPAQPEPDTLPRTTPIASRASGCDEPTVGPIARSDPTSPFADLIAAIRAAFRGIRHAAELLFGLVASIKSMVDSIRLMMYFLLGIMIVFITFVLCEAWLKPVAKAIIAVVNRVRQVSAPASSGNDSAQ